MGAILMVIDGMTDQYFRLDQMPNLEKLAGQHAYGQMDITPEGMHPDTAVCALTLLSYDEQTAKDAGRGWLEALGEGLPMDDNDLICKASWVRLDSEGRLVGTVDMPEPPKVPGYYHLGGYRGLLFLDNCAKYAAELVTIPPHQHMGKPIENVLPHGCQTLEDIVQQSRTEDMVLIPWGHGIPGELTQQPAAVITAVSPLKGIAWAAGMDLIQAEEFTGDVDTALHTKVEATLYAADRYPFVLLHINGADEASHRLDKQQKQDFLQQVDGLLPELVASGHRLLVCSDHGSDPDTGAHLDGPQPFVLANTLSTGDLGRVTGRSALMFLL